MKTRMLKAACGACGYTVRASRRWLRIGTPLCPDSTCARYGQPMESEEWEAHAETEFEALQAELEAWEAEAQTFRLLRENVVRIQKRRDCNACLGECQIGEPMRHVVYTLDGVLHSEYHCTACHLDAGKSRPQQGTARHL